MIEKIKKLASSLTKSGLKKQEVVALCIGNSIYYPVIILAVNACNAIMSPCNPNYTECKCFLIYLYFILIPIFNIPIQILKLNHM